MNEPFLALAGAFITLNGVGLYLLREKMARSGVDGWAWLPDGTDFKTYRFQLLASKVAAAVVFGAGLVFLLLFFVI
ncbi:hypothetical protein LN996_11470 [Arthrobacter sp. AK01]|uniref:hypothetical protein n=1 Tax=Micrococcaceae TaxID=1268 RepID=UPI001E318D04|nr:MULTISPECIES: hypothetical protein [Micrococcaceae]MCD4851431.1 hypothetical protein [Arthrobacter sp. AK01]MCP1412325.1 hypothetical protein [Paenarthrobacter sp. A20]